MKTIIHVNQQVISHNRRHGTNDPPITVKTYKSNQYAHNVRISGPCELKYSPHKPMDCGARLWLETQSEVEIID